MSYSKTLEKIFDNQGQGPKIDPDKIPFATSLSSDSSTEVASTEWINDWFTTNSPKGSYYVDPVNGDDENNSGETESSPFKTIQRVQDIFDAQKFPFPQYITIHLAAGTYGHNLYFSCRGTTIQFHGPSSGYASFTGANFNSPQMMMELVGNFQFSGELNVFRSSSLVFRDGTNIKFHNANSRSALYSGLNSIITTYSGDRVNLIFSGANTFSMATICAVYGGKIAVDDDLVCTVEEGATFTSGRRHYVRFGSGISGTGGDTNRFPGFKDGYIDETSYFL